MQVRHGLTRVGAAVADHPVATRQPLRRRDSGDDLKNVGDDGAVFLRDAVAAGDVDLGDHQNVGRCLGVDVPEGEDRIILVDLGGGDIPRNDFAEQTIGHLCFLLTDQKHGRPPCWRLP